MSCHAVNAFFCADVKTPVQEVRSSLSLADSLVGRGLENVLSGQPAGCCGVGGRIQPSVQSRDLLLLLAFICGEAVLQVGPGVCFEQEELRLLPEVGPSLLPHIVQCIVSSSDTRRLQAGVFFQENNPHLIV